MPDPLHEAIETAIERPLDPTLFERCAVDLLHDNYYPNLRGTPQGHDAGIDGIAGPDAEPGLILVSTTNENPGRNLKQSIRSHLDAGGPGRRFVFATTREITGKRRLQLRKELKDKFGVQLHAVHDRGDFVRLLYDHPRWRKDLLDIPGVARALSRFPAKSRPTPQLSLIGRDDDVDRLRAASGDLVLVGKPGVGKTFLLERLVSEGWGLFDVGWDIADLEDAIREMRPQRVVIDDAHLNLDRTSRVRWLRGEMDCAFGIVAVSWPGQADTVRACLPTEAARVDVEELERDQIVQVIEEAGVSGPADLQRLIVDQSHGRVGLAVTLARACVAGRVEDVATGEALLDDLARWYGRTLGPESRYVLGALALAGDTGATLEQVSEILDLPLPESGDLIRGLAWGGTIDEAPHASTRRMRVQPEPLRYALVRDVFFGDLGSLDAARAITCLDRPSIAAIPLIGAAHRGADIDRGLLQSAVDWTDERAATEYACLGAAELRTALDEAPQHRTAVSAAVYKAGIDTAHALQILMEQAVGDARAEHNTMDHPLRIVGDHLAHPEAGIAARRLAVEVAEGWLRDGGDAGVGLRVLMHAVQLGMRSASLDPGIGNTVMIHDGVVPRSWIDEIARFWDSILGIVAREQDLPPAPLLNELHYWVHPSLIRFGQGPDEETAATIRTVAGHVIKRLAEIFRDRPGVLQRLRDYVRRGEFPVRIDVPDDFTALFPERWDGSDEGGGFEGWECRAGERVSRLAEGLREHSVDHIATLITDADTDATAAGISYERYTPRLAQILAEDSDEPEALLIALEQHGAAPDLLFPFLDRAAELQRPGWEAAFERLLAVPEASWVPIHVALTRPCGDRLKRLAVRKATPWLGLVDALVRREEIDHATLALLFEAPDPSVRQVTAVTMGTMQSGRRLESLPPATLARWREIIVESPADNVTSPADEERFAQILRRDGQLCADWLLAWFRRHAQGGHEFLPEKVRAAIASLPADVRVALIEDAPASVSPTLHEVVRSLVSGDLDVMVALFDRSELDRLHGVALRGGPSEAWMVRALMALDRGWDPECIVAETQFSESGWSGEESQHWQRKVDAFARLRQDAAVPQDTRRERIVKAGIAYFEHMRDAAAEREHHDRVFGR